jgi:hypothetical protein
VIVGIVVGIVSLLIGVVLILFFILFFINKRRRRRRRKQTTSNKHNTNTQRRESYSMSEYGNSATLTSSNAPTITTITTNVSSSNAPSQSDYLPTESAAERPQLLESFM